MVNKLMFWGSWLAIPISILMRESTTYVVILSHLAITYAAYLAMGEDRLEREIHATKDHARSADPEDPHRSHN